METFILPREAFNAIEAGLGSKERAEVLASAIEMCLNEINQKARESILEKKEHVKIEIKEEIKNELVTRELFGERFNYLDNKIDERFNYLDNKIEERFNYLDNKIEERFTYLNNKIDERFTYLDNKIEEKFNYLDNKIEERFATLNVKIDALNFKFNILVALMIIVVTFANPNFINLIEKIFK